MTTFDANNAPVALELTDISLKVQDGENKRTILDDISLSIRAGEVVGLVGPSGSGKSTLLTIAGCLKTADSGTVTLYSGADRKPIDLGVRGAEAAAIRRNHIGIVFQQPNLLPSLTVKQQLLAMRRLGRVFGWPAGGRRAAEQRAEELLDAVGLAGFGDRRVSQLSGGQQARVNVARALMNNPEVLLVDEPTAALDQKTAGSVTRLIMNVTRKMGVATLYITHDLNQLHGADRVVEMVDGKLQPSDSLVASSYQVV
ncbi:MAG: ABC transporter ATP-binding protein [Corynebacterium sp.]|uniref:ABC transporter ATP-binding protein n=1 Tax=Corynebacterium sp. TaxID=1720 RepID=UPI0026DB16D5|nr:ABC transporter ATP-binding protein [Corynebacterium sp.]MDO5030713.1 ABC transporter ATP-binding protein [Corynebacterium sp.]